jgi:hypothetical protein
MREATVVPYTTVETGHLTEAQRSALSPHPSSVSNQVSVTASVTWLKHVGAFKLAIQVLIEPAAFDNRYRNGRMGSVLIELYLSYGACRIGPDPGRDSPVQPPRWVVTVPWHYIYPYVCTAGHA